MGIPPGQMSAFLTLNSFSSSLMLGTTLYRNQAICHRLVAQVGYGLIAIVSAFETVIACILTILALVLYPCWPTLFVLATTWLGSSVFSIAWSITDFILNLFVDKLVADESSARETLAGRALPVYVIL